MGVAVSDMPSGTVSFLFTDIEDSTRLWRQYPESIRDALARHDAILASTVQSAGGSVVKTTGDGVHAVSAAAQGAIAAAVAAQVAVGDEPSVCRSRSLCGWGFTVAQRSCVTVTTTAPR